MLSKVSLDGPSFFPGFLGSYILFLALTSSSSSAFLTGLKNSHSSFRQCTIIDFRLFGMKCKSATIQILCAK